LAPRDRANVSKHSLLLVDGDTRSLRVLEVSLRKAGFTVTSAHAVQDALDKLELGAPDLIISETTFPDGDGFELRRRVRASADWADIPFVFLTAEVAIENKIRGLELGVDDYLTKPIYIKEIVARINILLQKRQRARFEERRDGRMRFAGRVADMPVVDVIQTIEISRKSGVIQFTGDHGRQGAIYFRDGKVIDAEAGSLQGEDAVYRLLTWSEGDFEVVFRTVRRRDAISTSSQGLLMEGMRRLDEWSRLLEQLPPLEHRFEIDTSELAIRLGEVPDDHNEILRLIDGKRTLIEVIDGSHFSDLECLQAISRLYFEGLLLDLDHGIAPKRDTGKPMPLVAMYADEVVAIPVEPSTRSPIAELVVETFASLPAGYRPSALRLIEEAVLAAEAVEPTLSDVPEAPAVIEMAQRIAREAAERALETEEVYAVPHIIEADEPIGEVAGETDLNGAGSASVEEPYRAGREDSGLRMIGSLGRDRAEASGELAQMGPEQARAATQRELVTILPRRITREVPIVAPPTPLPLVTTSTTDVEDPEIIEAARRQDSQRQTTVVAAGGTRRASGPSLGAIFLLLLAAVLAALAIYTRLHRDHPRPPSPSEPNVGASSPHVHSALVPIVAAIDAAPVPTVIDALEVSDAPPAALDAARPLPIIPTLPPEELALQLMTQARVALDANHPSIGLDLAARSLRLHRTTNTYLVRARALEMLGHDDAAAADLVAALELTPTSSHAWDTAARLQWTMHHWDDARASMQRYLELVPDGASAVEFRHRLTEPK
jgi:CheY-like chemotaxis protein